MIPDKATRRGPGQAHLDAPNGRQDRNTGTAPALVSDKTATTILSLPSPTTFIPFVSALGITPVKVGRRWYARLDLILRAIDERTGATPRATWSEADMLAKAIGGRK
jgi:hypothetical protein